MNRRLLSLLAALATLVAASPSRAAGLPTTWPADLRECRPWVYWFIMDGNFSREGITADLEAMQKAGIGGVILMEVDVGVPRGPVRFMSEAWRKLFAHAVREAERLGLQITLNAGPGWTGSGGPWVKPEQSMQHLVASETQVTGPKRFTGTLPRPKAHPPFFGESPLPGDLEKAKNDFYVDVAVLAFPTPAPGTTISDIEEKALYIRAPYSSQPGVKPSLPAPAEYPTAAPDQCIATNRLVELTSALTLDGHLTWEVPAGNWTILRFGRRSTGQNTRPAPLPGLGLESDKFDPVALEAHFESYIGPLLRELGPRKQNGTGWTTLHIDSWEMGAQNWSGRFREEFVRRRGYDPLPYVPAMTGRVVTSPEVSERFLWDLRQTAQELVIQNHARHLKELGRKHGFGLTIEPYDMNPCADLSLGGEADVPMCEFWARGYGFSSEFSCYEATSIAHTLGRSIVAAESFTSDDRERWQLYPGAMKNQGDWAFCVGINRIVFHRFQHQPVADRVPGFTMGPYGAHWERTQTWWEMVPAYHQYLARCQYLLRRGSPVADICYLLPEGAPQVFRPPKDATRGTPPDRPGYNFDGIAPEVLCEQMQVDDGQLILPQGMAYRVLVLPERSTMTPALLRKVRDLAQAGATVVGAPPRKSPGLAGFPHCDTEVQSLAKELWGEGPAPETVTERSFGKGRIVWGGKIGKSASPEAEPDPLKDAKWIWHAEGDPASAAPVAHRYFQRKVVLPEGQGIQSATVAMTADNAFELRVNGQVAGRGDNFHETPVIDVAALLHPGANLLAVDAENGGDKPNPAGLIGALTVKFSDGKVVAVPTDASWCSSTSPASAWDTTAATDWPAAKELGAPDMAPWNRTGKSAAPPEAYPPHALVADLLKRSGTLPDFEADQPLRYTHRHEADGDIYFVSNPLDRVIEAAPVFRVNGHRPELWDAVTGEQRPLPDFAETGARTRVPLRFEPHQSWFVIFRKGPAPKRPSTGNFVAATSVLTINGPWQVQFEPRRGAPAQITMDTLADWSKHSDAGVRHFSGVATYRTQFEWQPTAGGSASRLSLDLGRVQVMAGVKLNGRDLGVVWTTPPRLDTAGALRSGVNTLEVRVANLWPNRLIGDASLPEPQRVTWTTWSPFTKDMPLLESGLLGPVRVLRSERGQ